jgi:hypothetical protein
VPLLRPRITPRRHRVGKDEESGTLAAHRVQSFEQQVVFVLEHGAEAAPAHVTVGGAVDGVAHVHVVSGDGFGDGARSAAHPEKPARDLLAGADLGKGAVIARIEIDPQRFLVGSWDVPVHGTM